MATSSFEFCRLCLRRKRSNIPTHAVDSLGLHARVLWVFQIKLYEGDGLPSQMCNTCLDRLSVAQQLKETILSVDTTLRLRGSSFYEQDQSMSVDDGVIPLLAVKMDQMNGEEEGKKRRGRKRRRKTDEEDADPESQTETELDKYGIQFTEQHEPAAPVKEEPSPATEEFSLKDVDPEDDNHDYSFHSVLEIKEELEEDEAQEEEEEADVTRLQEYAGAEANYLREDEPELVIDEGPEELEEDGTLSVPVLSLAEDDDPTPMDCLRFVPDDEVPLTMSAEFRGETGPDGTGLLLTPAMMPTFEAEEEVRGAGDVEDVLPVTQVFKSARQRRLGGADNNNDAETSEDSLNDSSANNREESGSDFSLQDAMDGSRIIPVKERHRCERCKRWYVNFVKLSQHRCRARPLKTKKTINYVKCSLCEDVFYKLSDLNEHVRSHRHVESLQCSLCERRFTNKTGLTRHMSLCHKQEAWASQVGHVVGTAGEEGEEEGVEIVEEKQPDASERSILKALLAGQRVHLATGAHKVT